MRKIFLTILVLSLFGYTAMSQTDLNSKIPIDPDIRMGTLSNGLRYYIKKNKKPENRAELRLVVNAGSVLETDQQQGLAHFLEHMCFNGTKHFKKNDLINFLEEAGVKFGAHLNAYTSFDETVYMLQLPTDKQEIFNKGLLVLEDWAHNVSFEPEEIDKERGVILEERRLGLGASERMREQWFPIILKNSRYAKRLPIGKKEVIEKCPYKEITEFYNTWYRPDLMAVIVVGDIDVDKVEKQVKEHFNKLKARKNPKKRDVYDIPDNDEPLVAVASDKENTYTVVQLQYKHKNADRTKVASYRSSLMAQLYNVMLSQRIAEIAQNPESPFLFANSSFGGYWVRTKSAYSSFAVPKENKINEALEVLLAENEKVKRFGFTQSELDRAKKIVLINFEKMAKEADKAESRSLAGEYVRNFLSEEAIPGIKKEYEYAKEFVPQATVAEINGLAKKWITDKNMTLLVLVKEADGIKIPTTQELLDIVKASKNKKYEAYKEEISNDPIMAKMPKAGKVISKTENKEFGLTTLTFSNNVKVILKPTDFKNDEILFTGFANGGNSLAETKDLLASKYMASIINQSGFGNFDVITLKKRLAGNTAHVRLTMNELRQGISGNSSPKDFETLLQLTYQYFTNARKDEKAFKKFLSNMENQIKFLSVSPDLAFADKLTTTVSSNNPRVFIFPKVDELNKLKLDDVYNVYKQAFNTANGYTFIIVGNIDIAKITPLLEQYIGSLPTSSSKRNWIDRKVQFPKGITQETVYKGKEDKSKVVLMFNGKYKWGEKNYWTAKILLKTLSIKLRESMREDQGGVYGVGARISLDKLPKPEYTMSIGWGCAPANIDKLVKTVFVEMDKIVKNGPTDVDIKKAKETFINERETQVKENNFWLHYIKSINLFNDTYISFDQYKAVIKSITKKDLQKAAKKYFTPKHYVKVVLKPEKMK